MMTAAMSLKANQLNAGAGIEIRYAILCREKKDFRLFAYVLFDHIHVYIYTHVMKCTRRQMMIVFPSHH